MHFVIQVAAFLLVTVWTLNGYTIPSPKQQLHAIKKNLKIKHQHLCEKYKMTCEPGEVCRLKVIMWPRVTAYPVCKPPRQIRGNMHICRMKPDVGKCNNLEDRWYYNVYSGACLPFKYTGCHGNANNFKNKDECSETCTLARSNWLKNRRRMWKWRNRKKMRRNKQRNVITNTRNGIVGNQTNKNITLGVNEANTRAALTGGANIQHRPLFMYRRSFRSGRYRKLFSLLRRKTKGKYRIGKPKIKVHIRRLHKRINTRGRLTQKWLISTTQ